MVMDSGFYAVDPGKNQNQSGVVAVDSGFAIFVARQYGATNRESLR